MLHFKDSKKYISVGQDAHDALYRIRPIILHLQKNFQPMCYPEAKLSLDEETCPFKGRVVFRVYNTAKPNKWGMKLFQLCESNCGY